MPKLNNMELVDIYTTYMGYDHMHIVISKQKTWLPAKTKKQEVIN